MLRDIDSFEITLDKPDTLFEFWNEGSIIAGSDATKDNGYTTTITHFYFSRANETDKSCHSLDIPTRFIRFNNDPIDSLYDFMEKSPDRNGDGKVGLSDLAIFGETYNKCISDDEFDCWFKFHSGDTCVNLSDFALMGVHKLHEYDPPQQLKTPNEESTSGLIVQLEGETITEGDIEKHLITIYLENIVGNKLLFMGLDYDRNILAFNKWNPNPSFPNRSAVAPISDHHGGDWLATAAFKLDCYSTSNIELGTLEFIVKNSSMTIDEDDIWINFADVLEENGKESKIYGLKYYPDEEGPTLTTRLAGNYPNPFNPSTVIEYSIAKGAHVNLSIYNVNGQLVCTLVDEFQKRNTYKRVWDGRNNRGITVASGVYFLKMKTESCVMTKKLVILR